MGDHAHSSFQRLLTSKSDIGSTRLESLERPALSPGEVLLGIEQFALTANNLTYAAFGDAMRYWEFFPTGQDGWGLMPVWGFASVIDSTIAELPEGERYYGYFPMAGVLKVQPGRISERGFYDLTDYRQPLPSPYNQYTRCASDPAYLPDLEDYQMLLRPLFITSWMLADLLEDNRFHGADQLVFSSASSKTAYGTAYCLGMLEKPPRLVGLTSAGNRDFVASLGLYDDVLGYDDTQRLARIPTTYVDFSGRTALRKDLHERLAGALRHDCFAGSAANFDFSQDLAGLDPKPQPFFAPDQIRKRNRDWGPQVLAERFGAIQTRFLQTVSDPARGWLQIEAGQGFKDAAEAIRRLYDSGGKPDLGLVIRL
jgi:hypothetical protein